VHQADTKRPFESDDISVSSLPLEVDLPIAQAMSMGQQQWKKKDLPLQLDSGNTGEDYLRKKKEYQYYFLPLTGKHTQDERFWRWSTNIGNVNSVQSTINAVNHRNYQKANGCTVGHRKRRPGQPESTSNST
jgi:hypothetical protein